MTGSDREKRNGGDGGGLALIESYVLLACTSIEKVLCY